MSRPALALSRVRLALTPHLTALRERLAPLARSYAALAPRERLALRALAVLLGLAVLWLLVWQPAWRDTQRLPDEIATLRAEAILLDARVREAHALSAQGSAEIPSTALAQAIAASLTRVGLETQAVVEPDANQPRTWEIHLHDAPATAALDWLVQAPASLRLRLQALTLTRSQDDGGRPRAGRVSGRATLTVPQALP